MKDAQTKITQFVRSYEEIYAEEFGAFKVGHKQKLDLRANKYATLKGAEIVQRELYEIPESLYNILLAQLNKEESDYIRSKVGSRWFARAFPEFRITEKV